MKHAFIVGFFVGVGSGLTSFAYGYISAKVGPSL